MSENRRIVILGASGGIGSSLAQRCYQSGWQTVLVGRDENRLRSLSETLGNCQWSALDATKSELVDSFFERTQAQGDIQAIVNCVGSLLLKPAHMTTSEEFRSVIETNLFTAFHAVRNGGRHLKSGGSVVLVSSCAAQIGLANHEAIAAAKAGIEGLTRSAAATYAAKGIRINCVAPGLVRTPLSEKITSNKQAEAYSLGLHPLGRLGQKEDIASAIEFLLSESSTWITGHTLACDGGLSSIKIGR